MLTLEERKSSVVVRGDVERYRGHLSALGGRPNADLRGEYVWVFQIDSLDGIRRLAEQVNRKELPPTKVDEFITVSCPKQGSFALTGGGVEEHRDDFVAMGGKPNAVILCGGARCFGFIFADDLKDDVLRHAASLRPLVVAERPTDLSLGSACLWNGEEHRITGMDADENGRLTLWITSSVRKGERDPLDLKRGSCLRWEGVEYTITLANRGPRGYCLSLRES